MLLRNIRDGRPLGASLWGFASAPVFGVLAFRGEEALRRADMLAASAVCGDGAGGLVFLGHCGACFAAGGLGLLIG